MRKSFIFVLSLFFVFWITRASYESESIDRFINSPSYEKLQFITDEKERFCELNYKKHIFSERWVY